ncbi:MAG: glutaredoxin family protein [Burkholderiales bacterium]|nr:glutaredoxin family protein [Burkholderiales bacterium]
MSAAPVELTLYGRRYCHLCEEMERTVAPLAAGLGMTLRYVDVDADPALDERYGARVPVLACGGRELAAGRADAAALRERLAEIR